MSITMDRTDGFAGMERGKYTFTIVLVLSVFSAFFVYFPITNTDIWWHLTAAREMFAQKSILYFDPFSYTLNNPEWINLHWIFQLLAYVTYTFSGAGGLVFIKCITVFGMGLFLSLIFQNKRYMICTATIFTLLIYSARHLILARPLVITLVCIAIFICFFERFLSTRKLFYLFLLLPLQIIWTNSQGLFLIGPVIAGCYLLGNTLNRIVYNLTVRPSIQWDIKKILPVEFSIFFLLILCSCLLNPYGWQGFLFPFKLLGRIDPSQANIYARNISENMPFFSLTGKDIHYTYAVILATVGVLLSFLVNIRDFRWTHILLFGIFLYLAFMAKRNIILYFIVIPPIIGYNYSVSMKDEGQKGLIRTLLAKQNRTIKMGVLGTVAIILIFTLFLHARTITKFPTKSTLSPFRVPTGAVEYLKDHPVEGRMFNSIRYGGYLMWHFSPEKKVYIDGRLIIRPPGYFADYLSILDNPVLFPPVADRFGITHAILPTAIFYRSMPLVKWLYISPAWDMVFADGNSVVFVKSERNSYKAIQLDKDADVEKVRNTIAQNWMDDNYIQDEALLYFNNMVNSLNNNTKTNVER
jgi:hypothetical protein